MHQKFNCGHCYSTSPGLFNRSELKYMYGEASYFYIISPIDTWIRTTIQCHLWWLASTSRFIFLQNLYLLFTLYKNIWNKVCLEAHENVILLILLPVFTISLMIIDEKLMQPKSKMKQGYFYECLDVSISDMVLRGFIP